MADYGNLDGLIDGIVEAAISLDMLFQQRPFRGSPSQGWRSTDNNWTLSSSGTLTFVGTPNESLPLSYGTVVSDYEKWIFFNPHDVWAKWPPAVRGAFADWRTLPDPGSLSGAKGVWQDAVADLTTTVASERGKDGTVTSLGTIDADLAGSVGTLANFPGVGHTMESFRSNVSIPLERWVLPLQRNVAAIAAGAVESEQEVWRNARQDVADIAEAALRAFKNERSDSSGGGGIFKVIGSVANILSILVLATPAAAASGTLALIGRAGTSIGTLLDEAQDPNPTVELELSGWYPDDILTSLTQALADLNHSIHAEEERLATMCRGVANTVAAHPELFDISEGTSGLLTQTDRDEILPDDSSDSYLHLYWESMQDLAHTTLPAISTQLQQIRGDFGSSTSTNGWNRPGTIGLGATGPFDQWSRMVLALDQAIDGSAKHLLEASAVLDCVTRDFQNTDDAVANDHLAKLHRQLTAANAPTPPSVRVGRGD